MYKKRSTNFDKFLFIIVIIAALYGIIAIFSATRSLGTNSNVIIQSASLCLGLCSLIALTLFDYEQLDLFLKPIAISLLPHFSADQAAGALVFSDFSCFFFSRTYCALIRGSTKA